MKMFTSSVEYAKAEEQKHRSDGKISLFSVFTHKFVKTEGKKKNQRWPFIVICSGKLTVAHGRGSARYFYDDTTNGNVNWNRFG